MPRTRMITHERATNTWGMWGRGRLVDSVVDESGTPPLRLTRGLPFEPEATYDADGDLVTVWVYRPNPNHTKRDRVTRFIPWLIGVSIGCAAYMLLPLSPWLFAAATAAFALVYVLYTATPPGDGRR